MSYGSKRLHMLFSPVLSIYRFGEDTSQVTALFLRQVLVARRGEKCHFPIYVALFELYAESVYCLFKNSKYKVTFLLMVK